MSIDKNTFPLLGLSNCKCHHVTRHVLLLTYTLLFRAGFGGGVGGRLRSSYPAPLPGGGLLHPVTVEELELITITLWFRVSTTSYDAFTATTVVPVVSSGLNVI